MPRPSRSSRTFSAFAAIAPGFEDALVAELGDIGVSAQTAPGGAAISGDLTTVMAVNLWSRVAGRVTVEVGRARATSLEQLATGVRALQWGDLVWPTQPIDVKVTVARSRLRRDLVARKVEHAVRDALRGPRLPGPRPPREPAGVGIRITGDAAFLTVDASGDLLHRRGWRKETAKAPLRENLAAAVLRVAQWSPGEPLVDPMCGSGTFAIEAAGVTLGHPPGDRRRFAFERWPCFDPAAWKALLDEARSGRPDQGSPIVAADRDAGAVRATGSNADRARVARRLDVRHSAFADLEPPAETGLIVLNPPWGERIASSDAGYAAIGRTIRDRWPRWRVAVLVPTPRHARSFGLNLKPVVTFSNGGLDVVLATGWAK